MFKLEVHVSIGLRPSLWLCFFFFFFWLLLHTLCFSNRFNALIILFALKKKNKVYVSYFVMKVASNDIIKLNIYSIYIVTWSFINNQRISIGFLRAILRGIIWWIITSHLIRYITFLLLMHIFKCYINFSLKLTLLSLRIGVWRPKFSIIFLKKCRLEIWVGGLNSHRIIIK